MTASLPQTLTLVLSKADKSAMEELQSSIGSQTKIEVLSEDKALDLIIDKTNPKDLLEVLMATGIPFDYCLQNTKGRKKGVLLCDMDSTLIAQECIDELADFVGLKNEVSAITEQAMRGEIDFDGALTKRVGLLEGLPLKDLQACYDKKITLNVGAKTLCQTMKANGAHTVIVSGGFTFFTGRVADACGFDANFANILIDDGTALTGKVQPPILGREAKLNTLEREATGRGGPENVLCIGDGANDLAMIKAAGLGGAYYAKPAVAREAHCKIEHSDLTTALYFQGYKEPEFVRD
jgi:phosphoserine phosphatase